jgi:energy-coupling factor transporter ATP-binding protein EcfA2
VNACIRAERLLLRAGRSVVVEGISFAAFPGDRIAILGANGSGKTTLARAFLGFAEYQGLLEIEGRDVRTDPRLARRAVAAVFGDADPQLLMPTVYDELAFSLEIAGEGSTPDRVRALAGRFGVGELLQRHPSRLSSGEKRRTLLALSIGRRPSILVLDEPTADLDVRGTRALGEILAGLPETIVLATHDYEMALSLCRKALLLGRGRSAFFEDIRQVFRDPALPELWDLV